MRNRVRVPRAMCKGDREREERERERERGCERVRGREAEGVTQTGEGKSVLCPPKEELKVLVVLWVSYGCPM